MGPIRARRNGCVEIAGLDVTFKKGHGVTEIAEQVSPKALEFLLSPAGSWEDISESIAEEKERVAVQTAAIEAAKEKVAAAKADKSAKGKKVTP